MKQGLRAVGVWKSKKHSGTSRCTGVASLRGLEDWELSVE